MKIKEIRRMKEYRLSMKRGFSLLEVIIALFVLSIGVVGMLSLISTSVINSGDARDVIVASQLAQEGIELIRNKRDTNVVIDPNNSFSGLNANVCRADAINGIICPSAFFRLRYAADATGTYRFVHSAGTVTKFYRKIVIEAPATVPSNQQRKIRSFVFWGNGWATPPSDDGSDCLNVKGCVYAETMLTDWAQNN